MSTKHKIMERAGEVWEAAVRIRGEVELRYIPLNHPDRHLAGQIPKSNSGYPRKPWSVGEHGRYLGTADDWARLKEQYAWIPREFDSYCTNVDPSEFDKFIADAQRAAFTLYCSGEPRSLDSSALAAAPIQQCMEMADGVLVHWSGEAARTFRKNFVLAIPKVAKNQAFVGKILMHAMIANKDVFVQAQDDLLDVAGKTLTALEASTGSGGGSNAAVVLTVVGAIATVGAGLATLPWGGAGAVAVFTIVAGVSSGMAGVGATFPSGPEAEMSADTVDGVLSNMHFAVREIQRHVTEHETTISSALGESYRRLTGIRGGDRTLFVTPRPALIGQVCSPRLKKGLFGPV